MDTGSKRKKAAKDAPRGAARYYGIAEVTVAVLIFYVLTSLFAARGIYHWTTKLPVSAFSSELRVIAKKNWQRAASWGLEEPEHSLETRFLLAQDPQTNFLPHTYTEQFRRRSAPVALAPVQLALNKPLTKATAKASGTPAVLVLGDSIMMTVGPVIKKDITEKLGGAAELKAKLATGLARPDVFDWVKELKEATASQHFDYIIMMLGTNDSQDFSAAGAILAYGTTDWIKTYNQRLASLMATACNGAAHGVWVGLPPMRSSVFNHKAARINAWARKQVAAHPCMQYVGIDDIVGDEHGRYTSYLKVDNRIEKIRMVDGIHVTAKGGSLISAALLDVLGAAPQRVAH